MVRGKTQMRRIENATSRQVTFSKRRTGLLKKAFELSILCDVQVAALVFSPKGTLYEFASSSLQEILERYQRKSKDNHEADDEASKLDKQHMMRFEATSVEKKIELLENAKRRLLGEDLGCCNLEELQNIEQQLERSMRSIRARKMQIFMEQIEILKEKEKALATENATLTEKYYCESFLQNKVSSSKENLQQWIDSVEDSHVETELFIGLPEWRVN